MELVGLLLFLGKLLLLMLAVGLPLLLLVVFLSDKIYKKIGPKYEELREKRIRQLQREEKKSEK